MHIPRPNSRKTSDFADYCAELSPGGARALARPRVWAKSYESPAEIPLSLSHLSAMEDVMLRVGIDNWRLRARTRQWRVGARVAQWVRRYAMTSLRLPACRRYIF